MRFGHDPDDAFDFINDLTGWTRKGLDEAADSAVAALRMTISEHAGGHGVASASQTRSNGPSPTTW